MAQRKQKCGVNNFPLYSETIRGEVRIPWNQIISSKDQQLDEWFPLKTAKKKTTKEEVELI
jgi:hypothetical protein